MTTIYMNDSDKTSQISDWKIVYDKKYNSLNLICYFPSGKSYFQPLCKCKVEPTEELKSKFLTRSGQSTIKPIKKATRYGNRFTVIYYPDNDMPEVAENENFEFIKETSLKQEPVFIYFEDVIKTRIEQATEKDKSIIENIERQFNKIVSHPDTALHAYCFATNQKRTPPDALIYPFGINESQFTAVESAFVSQISVIEGPPGTGKTQTILNIVANILLQNKTVAILSNNNSAVENVYEKLAKVDLDYLVAKLGNTDKRNDFFNNQTVKVATQNLPKIKLNAIKKQVDTLKTHLEALNKVASLRAEIDELSIEAEYLTKWHDENINERPSKNVRLPINNKKIIDFLAYLTYLDNAPISLKNRIQLLFKFNIIRTEFIDNEEKRNTLFYTLQKTYYELQLKEKRAALIKYQRALEKNEFDKLVNDLTTYSMSYLKTHLQKSIKHDTIFTTDDYKDNFDDFAKRYPIIGSSSHSIINSIGGLTQLDYLIIDEASQQDIIPALLGLACAKNVIIVGDRKQLPHIPVELSIKPPIEYYDCEKYSLLDSVISLFGDQVPVTLLKEHYRCHPKIIQFCNKQFYDNQLIPMTKDKGEDALVLITTSKGNHTRNLSNLREIDSLKEVGLGGLDDHNTGFISPYRKQVLLSELHLPQDIIKDTTHKFQGRECDNIIFSTVLDKKESSQRNIDFVDNPNLINVAVSRAKNRFVLITGNDVFTQNNKSIAALINYIKYYAKSEQVYDSPVVSSFDLLYKEYDKSLDALNSRLNKKEGKYLSEQIISHLLTELLQKDEYKSVTFHKEIHLKQLVSIKNNLFNQEHLTFINNGARCDFVIYFNIGKNPLGVIEVDGHYHNSTEQKKRDLLKNAILDHIGVPLLRLNTIESNIENKINLFLQRILYT